MRWNCPHCGVHLAIAEEKVAGSWSFSRCFQCGGYALVRRSEVNIIKVDRAPAGEKVILPEASEQPLLSRNATEALSRYTSPAPAAASAVAEAMAAAAASEKPVVKPAFRRGTSPGMANPLKQPQQTQTQTQMQAPAQLSAQSQAYLQAQGYPHQSPTQEETLAAFPEPLPEVPVVNHRGRFVPLAIGICGAMAIGSGLYLFIQGQNLMEQSQHSARANNPRPALSDDPNTATETVDHATPSASIAQPATGRVTIATATPPNLDQAAAKAPAFAQKQPQALAQAPLTAQGQANVQLHAPAHVQAQPQTPASVQSPARALAQVQNQAQSGNQALTSAVARSAEVNSIQNRIASNDSMTDQVRSQAMAPDRLQQDRQLSPSSLQPVQLSTENPPLVVRPKVKNTHLRAGPGMAYPVVGNADNQARYVVTDWNDRWFKVLPQIPPGGVPGNQAENSAKSPQDELTGWIRTDAVQVVQE